MEIKRALVVDDTTMIRASVRYCMENVGFEVEEASNGREGLSKLQQMSLGGSPPDIILIDINMPKMDGVTFIKKVRSTAFSLVPILVMTSETSKNRKIEGCNAGASGWLVKPFREKDLIAMIKKHIPSLQN